MAADLPKRSGTPRQPGAARTVSSAEGKPILRIEGTARAAIRLTLLTGGGASRADAEQAIREVLNRHWT